jgi:hypothetical protein
MANIRNFPEKQQDLTSPRLEKLFERLDPKPGRLVFALDTTASRQPTWDAAMQLQGQMFEEVAKIGGLTIQLVYFRGWGECQAPGCRILAHCAR